MDKFFSASTIALNTLWIKMYENKQSKSGREPGDTL